MKVVISVSEAFEKNIWNQICELKEINVWAVNMGFMNQEDEIELTEIEARKLELLK